MISPEKALAFRDHASSQRFPEVSANRFGKPALAGLARVFRVERMSNEADNNYQMLSGDGLATLVQLIATEPGKRISRVEIDGRTLWLKRYNGDARPLPKTLHAWISPILPVILRSSPLVGAAGAIEREARKMEAFHTAGFPVAEIVFRNAQVLALSDMGEVAQKTLDRLRASDRVAHDALLVDLAKTLGEVHAAGLCHGRPHPRDMISGEGRWGFIDFEEEPEAVMPLAMAQARDVWLMFLQISSRAESIDIEARAFSAYRSVASANVFAPLRKIVGSMAFITAPLDLVPVSLVGKDGQRMMKATTFLKRALTDAASDIPMAGTSTPMAERERPRGRS